MKAKTDPTIVIAQAIRDCLVSPNEADANLEAVNVVDGLFSIGRCLHRIADALNANLGAIANSIEERPIK